MSLSTDKIEWKAIVHSFVLDVSIDLVKIRLQNIIYYMIANKQRRNKRTSLSFFHLNV